MCSSGQLLKHQQPNIVHRSRCSPEIDDGGNDLREGGGAHVPGSGRSSSSGTVKA